MKAFTFCALILIGIVQFGCHTPGAVYETPEAATAALVDALSPLSSEKVRTVLGSQGVDLLQTGDAEADQTMVDRFVTAFRSQHEFITIDDEIVIVEVGDDGWPLPIPLVRSGQGWRFDTAAGIDEINARRVGRNELDVMQACHAIVDAQREYAAGGYGGSPGVYASRLRSTPGSRDGLYWETSDGEPPSPIGPFLADSGFDPGDASTGSRRSFAGYHFRPLLGQGRFAPGGAMDYVVDGRLTKGFAVIAWPVEYGETGVMTFMISHSGVLFERDFGPRTASRVASIHRFDPDPEWTVVPQDWE
ncbi:MAG: DUF2950 domain-containing protein [Phycisphaeraceae bacterium]|nr:DUF2950 domain-containing protein [Phycisphaeraceae bacterium]